jgi:PilZ domain
MTIKSNTVNNVNEQRKNQRFDLKLPFEIIRTGTNKVVGETKNVSSSGVLFTSDTSMAVGEPIEYLITFPKSVNSRSEVRLRCVGTVLREDAESKFAATLERYEFVRGR